MDYDRTVTALARAIEIAGIGVMVAGGLLATFAALARLLRGQGVEAAYHAYRADLGRAILLGPGIRRGRLAPGRRSSRGGADVGKRR
jgi:hypothetical protein